MTSHSSFLSPLSSPARPAGGVALEGWLPVVGDVGPQQPLAGPSAPAVSEAEPEPVPPGSWCGPVRVLPPAAALLPGGHATLRPHLQPAQAGAQQEAAGQLQVDLQHGRAPRGWVTPTSRTHLSIDGDHLTVSERSSQLITESPTCLSAGDHVIIGSYDCRLSWFDLDLSTKPYRMLRWAVFPSLEVTGGH